MRVVADDVSIAFDGTEVLQDVSVSVNSGEILAIVGPSGTGKTTLLRLLAAFRRPDDGTVTYDGRDIWSLSESERLALRRRMSMVFQEPSLFNAPVLANVTYGLRVRQSYTERAHRYLRRLVRRPNPPARAREALETVGLDGREDQNALSLSGGEKQRVAFARALAVEPDLLLLDEPTSNLDPRNTAALEEAMLGARQRGVGMALATHDMNQARRVADRVGVVVGGRLIEVGPTDSIFESPDDPRTRQFIAGELLYEEDGDIVGTARTS